MRRRFTYTITGVVEDIEEDAWGHERKKPLGDRTLQKAIRDSFLVDADPQLVSFKRGPVVIEPRKGVPRV